MFNQTHYLAMHTVLKTWFLLGQILPVGLGQKSQTQKWRDCCESRKVPQEPKSLPWILNTWGCSSSSKWFLSFTKEWCPNIGLGKKKKNMVPPTTSTAPNKSLTIFPSRHARDKPRCYRFPGPGCWGFKKLWENLQTQRFIMFCMWKTAHVI